MNFTEFPVTCDGAATKNISEEHQRSQKEEEEKAAAAEAEEAHVEQSRFVHELCQQL